MLNQVQTLAVVADGVERVRACEVDRHWLALEEGVNHQQVRLGVRGRSLQCKPAAIGREAARDAAEGRGRKQVGARQQHGSQRHASVRVEDRQAASTGRVVPGPIG